VLERIIVVPGGKRTKLLDDQSIPVEVHRDEYQQCANAREQAAVLDQVSLVIEGYDFAVGVVELEWHHKDAEDGKRDEEQRCVDLEPAQFLMARRCHPLE
jgi:hypothetical protein